MNPSPKISTVLPTSIETLFEGKGMDELQGELIRAKAELFKKSFYEFVKEFIADVMPVSLDKIVFANHIKVICDELQRIGINVAHRKPSEYDLIINICPGATKSTLCSVLWPVWCWTQDPTICFMTASHELELSTRFANKSRELIKSDHFKLFFPHIQLKNSQDNKGDYEIKQGGIRYSTSSGASPTGRHGIILLGDDVQNAEDANSDIERNNVNRWWSETFSSRLSDKKAGVMVVVQQRLHPSDITGYLLEKGGKYKHIVLPAELSNLVQPAELREIYIDGLLDPDRIPQDELDKNRIRLGARAYETQYGQNPQSEEAAILKSSMFPIIPVAEYQTMVKDRAPIILYFIDTAYTAKTNRDPSALLACTKIGENLYILNISIVRMEFPALLRHIRSWTEANGYTSASKIQVEPKASGQSIVQMLKLESGLNIKEGVSPKSGKEERLMAISNIVDSGRVCLVQGGWNQNFLTEVTASTPKHDDIRDCMVNSIETLLASQKNSGRYCLSAASY